MSWAWLLQADAYAGYDRLYCTKPVAGLGRSSKRHAGPMRGASSSTWRGSNKAPIAIEAVARIDALFAIERDINGLLPEERRHVRHERSCAASPSGRNNWTFVGSDAGGRHAAAIYTPIETAKLNAGRRSGRHPDHCGQAKAPDHTTCQCDHPNAKQPPGKGGCFVQLGFAS